MELSHYHKYRVIEGKVTRLSAGKLNFHEIDYECSFVSYAIFPRNTYTGYI